MKYIKYFENIEQKYKVGDYVRLKNTTKIINTNDDYFKDSNPYLYASICRMNKVTLKTIFKVIEYLNYYNNGDISDEPYCICILNNDADYIWVDEQYIEPVSEEEATALKYNL